jgi:hypothetical protein
MILINLNLFPFILRRQVLLAILLVPLPETQSLFNAKKRRPNTTPFMGIVSK